MKIDKLLDEFYSRSLAMNSSATQKIHRNLAKVNKECLQYIGISNTQKINIQAGYLMIRYYKEIMKNGNNSINKYMWFLKAALKYNNIKTDFYDFKKLPADTKSFKRIYNEDLKLIIDFVRDMNFSINSIVYKSMVFLLLDSGIRITELINIKIENVDFNREKILLEHTKSNKMRYAPFSNFSKPYLMELKAAAPDRDFLFWNLSKNRMLNKNDVKQFYRRLNQWLQLSENIHSHRFRKTFASVLRENNARLEAIQHLLGHSKIQTTMIYIDQSDDMINDEYRKHNNWKV